MIHCRELNKAYMAPVLLCLGLCLSACGVWKSESPPSASEKQIVILVCGEYLETVVSNDNLERLNSLMALTTYMENQVGLSKTHFLKQIESLQNRWSRDTHPLLNLDLKSIDLRGDDAEVSFKRRDGGEAYPTVTIWLNWSGTAWQVIDDSLFGPGNYVESINQKAATKAQ